MVVSNGAAPEEARLMPEWHSAEQLQSVVQLNGLASGYLALFAFTPLLLYVIIYMGLHSMQQNNTQ